LLKSLGVQDEVAQFRRGVRALPSLDQVNESTRVLWARTQVDLPFLVPRGLQSAGSHFRQRSREVRPTERAEAVLRSRANIGVTWIQGCPNAVEHQKRHKIPLIQHVSVSPGGEVPTTMHIPQLRIN